MHAPDFWKCRTPREKLIDATLAPVGWCYSTVVRLMAARAKPYRAGVPVICIGNLTAGGTGKTPVAIALAGILAARRANPFFLSRGYGGRMSGPLRVMPEHHAKDVGDEPLLLAAAAPTVVAHARADGASLAAALGAGTILMDDGHQNFSLHKDLSLVVIDAAQGFGNGRVLPAGPLREFVGQGLKRADAIVLVGEGKIDLHLFPGPVLRARLVPVPPPEIAGAKVFGFAGIGRPEKFFTSLEACGCRIAGAKCFADHHAYSASEIARLKTTAHERGALLVTTAKDYVRLSRKDREGITVLPIEAKFDDIPALERMLDGLDK